MFVPARIEKDEFEDIGGKISTNPNMITAIFNEYATFKSSPTNLAEVTLKEESFYIYNVNNPEINYKDNGSIIAINTQNINPDNKNFPIYLRIRIRGKNVLDSILKQHIPLDHFLNTSYTQNQSIDFRLNQQRNLPRVLLDEYRQKFLKIDKIHFFFMREFMDEYVMSNRQYSGYRTLEDDVWSDYLKNSEQKKSNININNMLAYHWKQNFTEKDKDDDSKDDFILSIKFRSQQTSKLRIVSFFALALLIGILGNLATQWIFGNKSCMVEVINIPNSKASSLIKMTNVECNFIFKNN